MQVFAGFSGFGNSIHNIIPLLKENVPQIKSFISLTTVKSSDCLLSQILVQTEIDGSI